ncbi:MAG: hypothetical protein ACREL6_09315, partial [Gemmatimonadales bacterium]
MTGCRARPGFRRRAAILAPLALACVPTFAGSMAAQDTTLAIPVILSLPTSVRQAGLAGANVAVIGDAGSVFSNPAGLAIVKRLSIETAFSYYPDRTVQTAGAAALRVGPFDFGVGANYLRFSDTSSVRDNLVWVGSMVYRKGLIAIGGTAKYVSLEDTTGRISRAITSDAGLAIAVFDISALAFSIQNISNDAISGAPLLLPTQYHLGFTQNFSDPQTTLRLMGTVEVVWTGKQARRTLLGFESGVVLGGVGLVARVGYGAQPALSEQKRFVYG